MSTWTLIEKLQRAWQRFRAAGVATSSSPSPWRPFRWSVSSAPPSTTATPTRSRPRCRPPPTPPRCDVEDRGDTTSRSCRPRPTPISRRCSPARGDRPTITATYSHQRRLRFTSPAGPREDQLHEGHGVSQMHTSAPTRRSSGATRGCASRSCSTTPARWRTTARSPRSERDQEPADAAAERRDQCRRCLCVHHSVRRRTSTSAPSNYNATWIDWTDWDANNGSCSKTQLVDSYDSKSDCTSARRHLDTANHNNWNGCVMDRGNSSAPSSRNYDTNARHRRRATPPRMYRGRAIRLLPDAAVMALNYNWSAMNDAGQQHDPERQHQPGRSGCSSAGCRWSAAARSDASRRWTRTTHTARSSSC